VVAGSQGFVRDLPVLVRVAVNRRPRGLLDPPPGPTWLQHLRWGVRRRARSVLGRQHRWVVCEDPEELGYWIEKRHADEGT
jgi:hypothetical protein